MGRSVALAERVNRITHSVEVPQRIRLFTPEDNIKMKDINGVSAIKNICLMFI